MLFALCFCSVIGVFAQSYMALPVHAEKKSYIGGKIDGQIESTIRLHFVENQVTQQLKIYEIPLDYEGEFHFEFPLDKVTLLTASYGDQDIDLYMEPGDAIKILSSGDNIRDAVIFEGKAAVHNTYLKESSQLFADYDDVTIGEELVKRNSAQFKKYMDRIRAEKKQFLIDFKEKNNVKFSEDFDQFAALSIDYWWAYHLMRYRMEHPAGNNMAVPMSLPTKYYDFLRVVDLSNDFALINRDYLYFLDLFLDFAKENPREWQDINEGSNKLIVRNSSVIILDDESNMPLVMPLDKGKALHIADERLFDCNEIDPDKFYRVETFNAMVGWMRGRDITFSNRKPKLKEIETPFTQTKEVENSYIENYIKCRFDKAQIREFPSAEDKVLGYLFGGEEAEFLLNQTTDKFIYRHEGLNYLDYWYRVRKKDGTEGWVFRGAVDLLERKVTLKEVKKVTYRLSNEVAKAYLNGKALYYALAKDIFERATSEEQDKLRSDVFNFKRINPVTEYTETVQLAYENALRRRAGLATANIAERNIIKVTTPPTAKKKVKPAAPKVERTASPVTKEVETRKLVEIDNLPVELKKSVVKIGGKVNNPSRYKMDLVLYTDPILYKENKQTVNLNADGSFDTEFKVTHGVFGELRYGNKSAEIWIEPGDNLQIVFDAANIDNSISFGGVGKENNKYLKDLNVHFAAQQQEVRTKMKYATPNAFQEYVKAEEQKRRKYFDNYVKQNNLSPSFYEVAQAEIDYWKENNLLSYPFEHPLYHNKLAPMKVADNYYDFIDKLNFEKQKGLPAKNYVYFLQQYVDYLTRKPENKGKPQIQVIKENLEGEAYYYSMTRLLTSECRRGRLATAGVEIKKFIEESPYQNYNNILRFAYNEAVGLNIGTKAPDFEFTDIDGNVVHLSDYKGKVVYIDFWATWCAPCRRYISYSQVLSKEMEGKDVVFLYISLDDNNTEWEGYVKTKSLDGVHIRAKGGYGYHSKIAELYKVKALPSYFLVGKDGRIAYNPAANPMSSTISQQINTLLEK